MTANRNTSTNANGNTAITPDQIRLAERAITRAKVGMIMDHPWFGTLATKLVVLEGSDIGVDTMATDGTRLYYHAPFINQLTPQELIGVMAHEVMHCAMLHPYRREKREMLQWNVACDYVINDILVSSGLTLPKNVLLDKRFAGMTSEKAYAMLNQEESQGKTGKQDKNGKNGIGGVMDAPKDPGKDKGKDPGKGGDKDKGQDSGQGKGKDKTEGQGNGPGKPENGQGKGQGTGESGIQNRTESDWQIDVVQAEKVASSAGKMPGHLRDELRKTRECKTNYREVLKRFIDKTIACDFSWAKPNRRMLGQGIVLPGIHKEGCGELVIGVDTSGSVHGAMLDQFAADIAEIIQTVRPIKTHVVYCDTRVTQHTEFEPDGAEFEFEKHVSRGGTFFQPVFDFVEENGIEPKALLYCTDLEPGDRPSDPGYPVLWCVPETCTRKAYDWGESVEITMDQNGKG
jgi:predicted metal-dependent peptidase